jgi:hypothetical protein
VPDALFLTSFTRVGRGGDGDGGDGVTHDGLVTQHLDDHPQGVVYVFAIYVALFCQLI